MIKLYTIGFTKKTVGHFFELLKVNHVTQLIDVRVHPNIQLAGFAKQDNMVYLCKELLGIPYKLVPDFAPPEDLMRRWRSGHVCRSDYVREYTAALEQRDILTNYDVNDFDGACFMCCEEEPEYCHRKLLVEYFRDHCGNTVTIKHLI